MDKEDFSRRHVRARRTLSAVEGRMYNIERSRDVANAYASVGLRLTASPCRALELLFDICIDAKL